MNNKLYFDLIYLKVVSAPNFGSFLTPIPILARYFGSSARLLLLPIPDACCCTLRIRQGQVTKQLTKIAAKNKTKPFQSHSKPFFSTPNPVLSEIIGIFDKFRTTFLCKTNPIFLMNKNINPILAQSFLRVQGVCLPDTGYVLSYIEDVRTGKNNAVIVKKNRQNTTRWSMTHQKRLIMQNEPNLDNFLTFELSSVAAL